MITIIQGTNRPDSNTEYICRHVQDLVSLLYEAKVAYVSMADLPSEVLTSDPYDINTIPPGLISIQDQFLIPAQKFIWISPEYNGSFPGVLKLFIDSLSVRLATDTFAGKKSALIGVTSGRSGNIRGLDHMASVLTHLRSIIYPWLLPISRIDELMEEGRLIHSSTINTLDTHIRGFLDF